jgi:N-acetylmuramoyl-L-alanine amidase
MSERFRDRPRRIVVHCSATREGAWYDAADIDRWHRARGWAGIGYHQVVLLDGTVEPGRPEHSIGAHVAGHNHDSLAVCYVGGVADDGRTPKDTRTPAQTSALLTVARRWMERYDIPRPAVLGHYELDRKKACPSFDMAVFRRSLSGSAAPAASAPAAALPGRGWLKPEDLPILSPANLGTGARDLQSQVGVTTDGIIGPETWRALARALGAPVGD